MKKILLFVMSVLLVLLHFSPSAFSQVPVVRIEPASVVSPEVGQQFSVEIAISGGRNVAGYQVMILYDPTALRAVGFNRGDYLPDGAFLGPAWLRTLPTQKQVRFAGTSSPSESHGSGRLGRLTFEVLEVTTSSLTLVSGSSSTKTGTLLSNDSGALSIPRVHSATVVTTSDHIGMRVPQDLISEVAFGPDTTYFVLNAKYPILTGVADADVSYGTCTITLDLPGVPDNSLSDQLLPKLREHLRPAGGNISLYSIAKELAEDSGTLDVLPNEPQYFIFPLKTAVERSREVEQEADRSRLIATGSSLVGLIPTVGSLLSLGIVFGSIEYERALAIDEILRSFMDPKVILDAWGSSRYTTIRWRNPRRPADQSKYVLILPKQVSEIGIRVEQNYVLKSDSARLQTAISERPYNLENSAFAAPRAQPIALADYPPFQLLPPEVQQYLLLEFAEFGTVEKWLIPDETVMDQNFPNPFNPETWIPYQLSEPAEVSVSIYSVEGDLVRTLALGHQAAGIYQSKSRAAYWDGRNTFGEPVASGVYFYILTAGEFTATRKMLIKK